MDFGMALDKYTQKWIWILLLDIISEKVTFEGIFKLEMAYFQWTERVGNKPASTSKD